MCTGVFCVRSARLFSLSLFRQEESDPNDSHDTSTSESPKSASQDSEKSTRGRRGSARSTEDPKPVKAGTKQTKMEDFGTKTKSGDKDSVVNGSAKAGGRRVGKGGAERGDSDESSKAAGEEAKVVSRKRQASGEEGSTAAAKRGKGAAVEGDGKTTGAKRQQAAG